MPRNPDKTRCEVPGCHNWAMRGHTRCRPHRDAELGPRGAGAPKGNLNALKHGRHSHPLPPPDLEHIGRHILEQPDDLPFQIGLAAQSLQDRTSDPLKTLVALRRLLPQLISTVAVGQFTAELNAFLDELPSSRRGRMLALIQKSVPHYSPVEMLRVVRELKKTITGTKQLLEPASTPSAASPSPPPTEHQDTEP